MKIEQPVIEAQDLCLWYGKTQALQNISMAVSANKVTAIIGPSGCGKSTFLKTMNRMTDLIDSVAMRGSLQFREQSVGQYDVVDLRRRIGMVFQKPNPFPKSIYENIVFGLRLQGVKKRSVLDEAVEKCLRQAALWDEVKDRLRQSGLSLSGGQQQRLCIARALAVGPEVLLMDEPCSALDPVATAKIEDLILELKENYTIIIVTHNMQQAARISQSTAFFLNGELIEYGPVKQVFENPHDQRTEDYITGRFG